MKQFLFSLLFVFLLSTVLGQDADADYIKQQVTIKKPVQTGDLEIYYMPTVGLQSSIVRNRDVDFTTSTYIIPATGTYLVVINASGINNSTYVFTATSGVSVYDETGFIYLKKIGSPAGVYNVKSDFFAKFTDNTATSSLMRYVTLPVSQTAVIRFTAGESIIVGGRVNSRGTPAYTWNVNYIQVVLVKLK